MEFELPVFPLGRIGSESEPPKLATETNAYRFLRAVFFRVAFFLVVFFPPAAFLSLVISADASLLNFATSAVALYLAAATCFFNAAASFL